MGISSSTRKEDCSNHMNLNTKSKRLRVSLFVCKENTVDTIEILYLERQKTMRDETHKKRKREQRNWHIISMPSAGRATNDTAWRVLHLATAFRALSVCRQKQKKHAMRTLITADVCAERRACTKLLWPNVGCWWNFALRLLVVLLKVIFYSYTHSLFQ